MPNSKLSLHRKSCSICSKQESLCGTMLTNWYTVIFCGRFRACIRVMGSSRRYWRNINHKGHEGSQRKVRRRVNNDFEALQTLIDQLEFLSSCSFVSFVV